MALSSEIKNWVWSDLRPEEIPTFSLPTNLATVSDLALLSTTLNTKVDNTAAEIGQTITTMAGAEALINSSIEAAVVLSAQELLAAQNQMFSQLDAKIVVVNTAAESAIQKADAVQALTTSVSERLGDTIATTNTKFGDVSTAIAGVDTKVGNVVNTVNGIEVDQLTQDKAITQLYRGAINVREVLNVMLESIPG